MLLFSQWQSKMYQVKVVCDGKCFEQKVNSKKAQKVRLCYHAMVIPTFIFLKKCIFVSIKVKSQFVLNSFLAKFRFNV